MAKVVEMGVVAVISGRVGSQVWKKGTPQEMSVLRTSILGSEFIVNVDMTDAKQKRIFDYVTAEKGDAELQIYARVEGNGGYYRYYFVSAEPIKLALPKVEVDEAELKSVFG